MKTKVNYQKKFRFNFNKCCNKECWSNSSKISSISNKTWLGDNRLKVGKCNMIIRWDKVLAWVIVCKIIRIFTIYWLSQWAKLKIGMLILHQGPLIVLKEIEERLRVTLQTKGIFKMLQAKILETLKPIREFWNKSNNSKHFWNNIKWIKERKKIREWTTWRDRKRSLSEMKKSKPLSKRNSKSKWCNSKDLKCLKETHNKWNFARRCINSHQT